MPLSYRLSNKDRTLPAKKPAASAKAAPAPGAQAIEPALVRSLAKMLAETGLSEIEVSKGDLRIRVARHAAAPAAQQHYVAAPALAPSVPAPTVVTVPAAKPADQAGAVKSPMVGSAFLRPSPDSKAFVEVGSTVKAGERILLIEAMKTFNDIVAPQGGVVKQILVEDGQPVEYGQVLMIIE